MNEGISFLSDRLRREFKFCDTYIIPSGYLVRCNGVEMVYGLGFSRSDIDEALKDFGIGCEVLDVKDIREALFYGGEESKGKGEDKGCEEVKEGKRKRGRPKRN